MEHRETKIIVNRAGGTAGAHSVKYRATLPSAWIHELDISKDNPILDITFDGESILIKPKRDSSPHEFLASAKAAGHQVKVYRYYHRQELCTSIYADFTAKAILSENHTEQVIFTAFGNKTSPDWQDFMDFLEDRCVPRSRVGIQYILDEMQLDEYDPVRIIEKTQGRMAEDKQWLSVSEES